MELCFEIELRKSEIKACFSIFLELKYIYVLCTTISFSVISTILSYIFGPELGLFLVVKEAKRTDSS